MMTPHTQTMGQVNFKQFYSAQRVLLSVQSLCPTLIAVLHVIAYKR